MVNYHQIDRQVVTWRVALLNWLIVYKACMSNSVKTYHRSMPAVPVVVACRFWKSIGPVLAPKTSIPQFWERYRLWSESDKNRMIGINLPFLQLHHPTMPDLPKTHLLEQISPPHSTTMFPLQHRVLSVLFPLLFPFAEPHWKLHHYS